MKLALVIAVLVLATAIACRREVRGFEQATPGRTWPDAVALTDFHAGGPRPAPATPGPYREQAYDISQGKQLFESYNCVGCHAHGGGAIGPALMDDTWIYGSAPAQIYSTIVDGRPNGMPSFAGMIPEQQVWQIVAYVRSLSGLVPRDAAPSRDDGLPAGRPENRRPRQAPKQTGHR